MNKMKFVSIAGLAAVLLSACVTAPTPKNAEEHRKVIAQGVYGAELETFVANRPYKETAALIKAKVSECLSARVDHQACRKSGFMGKSCNEYSDTYLPTVVAGPQRTELHVQFKREGSGAGEIHLGGQPNAGGRYVVVADFTTAENGKATKVDIYGNNVERSIPRAIRHWVNGTNLGCPDFKPDLVIPGMGKSTK
jgi:hypothetical protein